MIRIAHAVHLTLSWLLTCRYVAHLIPPPPVDESLDVGMTFAPSSTCLSPQPDAPRTMMANGPSIAGNKVCGSKPSFNEDSALHAMMLMQAGQTGWFRLLIEVLYTL